MLARNGADAFRMKIIARPRFKRPKGRWKSSQNACSDCRMLEECRECAAAGRVLACEAADMLDGMATRCR